MKVATSNVNKPNRHEFSIYELLLKQLVTGDEKLKENVHNGRVVSRQKRSPSQVWWPEKFFCTFGEIYKYALQEKGRQLCFIRTTPVV